MSAAAPGKPSTSTTIVSITPLTARHDSRTFRAASTFSRAGFRSVLVEGRASEVRQPVPFEVVTLPLAHRPAPSHIAFETAAWLRAGTSMPRADLYYVCSFLPWAALTWRRLRRSVPVIYDAQDYYPDLMGDGLAARVHAYEERRAMHGAAVCITSSTGMADAYEQHYGRRPLIVRNVHDTTRDMDVGRDLRSTLGLDADAYLVVVPVAERHLVADEAMTEAFAQLPDRAHLAFVGFGHRSRLEGLVATLGLGTRVHFVDPVHTTEVTAFLRTADAACIPYRAFHPTGVAILPNSAFHGIAAGLPLLLSTDLTEAIALFGDAALPVDPSAAASVAAGIRRLMDEPGDERRHAVGRLAEQLTWAAEERTLLGAVETALGSSAAPEGRPPTDAAA